MAELRAIRDGQAQMLAAYRSNTSESLTLQKQAWETQQRAVAQQTVAVDAQLRTARLYRYALAASAIVVTLLVFKLVAL